MLAVMNDEPLPSKESYIISKGNTGGSFCLDLIPCNIGLTAIEDKLRGEIGSEKAVSQILNGIKDDYDVILLDTAPSLNLLTVNALAASDSVIITVSPQYLSAIGLTLLMKTINKVKRHIHPSLQIEGILMTMCDNRTTLYKKINEIIQRAYSQTVNIFNTQIPYSVKVGEANLNHMSIIEYEPKNKVSIAYTALAEEVLNRG